MSRLRVLVLCSCLGLSACATLPPPYLSLPAGTALEDRQTQLQVYGVEGSFGSGYRVDGESVSLPELAEHLGHSPSKEAAETASHWGYYQGAGLLIQLASLIPVARNPPDQTAFLTLFSAGIGLQLMGAYLTLEPAAGLHNAYLRKDLELPADSPVSNPLTSSASAEGRYLFLGWGNRSIATGDLQDYFTLPHANPASNAWPDERQAVGELHLGLGVVSPNGFTWEGQLGLLDRGEQGRYFQHADGTQSPAQVLRLSSLSIELSPGYTLAGPQLFFGQDSSLFLGWDLGLDYLMARRWQEDAQQDLLGDYYLRQPTLGQGPRLRLLLPFNPKFGLALELGYHWERYEAPPLQDASGVFAGRSSPDSSLRGSGAAFDLSGPFLRLDLRLGHLPFAR